MQGVVGMLDIMHSTVMDAMASQTTQTAKSIFEELKSNIEVVQESSKRAVEAADNVVHAYDLNMQMPETPLATDDDAGSDESLVTPGTGECHRPDIVIEGNGISSLPNNGKRRRSEEIDFHPGPPLKRLTGMAGVGPRRVSAPLSHASDIVAESADVARRGSDSCPSQVLDGAATIEYTSRRSSEAESPTRSTAITSQNSGNIVTREFLSALVNDSTHNIHLVHKTRTQTEFGEMFQISTAGPRNQLRDLAIHIIVEPDVPDTIVAEEQHLQFALQKVVDNAIKFTESGTIRIAVSMARNAQLVEIGVSDTGCGITEESKAHLFKPHFQEDASISRAKDGLGLSLFNAKAHVRKNLGGDLTLERSATEGPNKGSEFLIRLPTSGPLEYSRPNTPRMGTPVPVSYSGSRQGSPQVPAMRALPPAPTSVPTPRRESLVAGKSVPTPRRDSLNPPNSAATTRRESLTSTPQASRSRKQPGFNPNLAKILPLNIMVAEDNAINRKLLVTYLKKLGFPKDRVVQAFDGVEAVQQYKMSLSRPPDKRIDVILMDLWMPNMDGYEATTKIYEIAEEHGENLAVMAVTADITSDSFERATEVGMQGFLTKPYTLLDIENMLLQHFHKD
jgi:CheY-like chemotaxis protein